MKKNNSKIQFLWEGKEEALLQHLTPPSCTYEQPNDIQGNEIHCVDNLDFLKLNQERLKGKVKCIYIDPPYNTGNDFIYNDKRHKGRECRHSNWLSFMYPRLILARELLREDGVIFISIDDNEVHHLRQIMNEVFGEGEFVATFIWEKKKKPSFLDRNVGKITEYVLCFAKNIQETSAFSIEETEEGKKYPLNNAGNSLTTIKFPPNSVKFAIKDCVIKAQDMSEGAIKTTLLQDVIIKDGCNQNELILEGEWRYSQTMINKILFNNELITISKIPFRPNHIKSGGEVKKMKNCLTPNHYNMETNEDATEQVISLLGGDYFDTPKPVKLIKTLIKATTAPNDLILDFFAGSGTTGQAVMELNQEEIDKQAKDGLLADKTAEVGGRKFILVQLPEKISEKQEAFKAGYRHISDITIERVRRAGAKYKGDVGFKVFDCIKKTELLEKYQ